MPHAWVRAVALDALIVISWLTSVGMVVFHGRGAFWGGTGHPMASLGATLDVQHQWFGIYYQGQKIGWSHMTLAPEERHGMPGVSIADWGELAFNLLGAPQQLQVTARAFIDANWRLQTCTATIRSASYHLTWTGERQGEVLVVRVTTPTTSFAKRLQDPVGSAFVNGLSSWSAFHRLRVGQSGKAWVLNPLALKPEIAFFAVPRREIVDGEEALVVETDVGGLTTTSWVTPAGNVLKETSPLGWELRRESRELALAPFSSVAPPLDLLSATSVPIDQPLDDPEQIDHLIVLVDGLLADEVGIQRPWQHVLAPERLKAYDRASPQGPWCLMQLDRPRAPHEAGRGDDGTSSIPTASVNLQRYQGPSALVQSDDPRIRATALDIVGRKTDPWQQTVTLNQWVFSTLKKQLTVGIPSAVDILATRIGDCHEHTVLFTALARSLGLPTRMVAGLVYWNGRFYYHAWPEVWVQQWLPTDPTLGQPLADATHLGLIEAENESLIALWQFIGALRIQVLALHNREERVS